MVVPPSTCGTNATTVRGLSTYHSEVSPDEHRALDLPQPLLDATYHTLYTTFVAAHYDSHHRGHSPMISTVFGQNGTITGQATLCNMRTNNNHVYRR